MAEEIRLNAPDVDKGVVLLCPNCHDPMKEDGWGSICPNGCVPVWAAPGCSDIENEPRHPCDMPLKDLDGSC